MPAAPTTTTLNGAMTRDTRSVTLTSGTGVSAGVFLVIGSEIVLVQEALSTVTFLVERGQIGTAARPHATLTQVYVSSSTAIFGTKSGRPMVKNDVTNVLPDFLLPIGSRVTDPETGFEYLVVDCQSAIFSGAWVLIDNSGLATLLTGDSEGVTTGRVGIITQNIGASDTLALALVVGRFQGAFSTSAFTSLLTPNYAVPSSLALAAGMVAPYPSSAGTSGSSGTSVAGNIIWGAVILDHLTSAVSSAGTLDVLLNNPYLGGVTVALHVGETS